MAWIKNLPAVLLCLVAFQVFGQDFQKYNMALQARVTGQPGTYLTDIWGYELNGNEYAIVGSREATNIYNVSDCSNPVLDTAFVDGYNSAWRDYKVYGGYAYGVCDGANCGLQVIKLTPDTPENPGEQYSLSTFSTLVKAHNIFIDVENARLYAVGARTDPGGSSSNILIYDLINPESPSLMRVFETKYTHDIYVEDNIGYCSHGNDYQLGIYDFTDVNNIITVGTSVPSTGYNHSGWKHPYEDVYYVAEEIPIGRSIYIYDISDPGNPVWSEDHKFKEPLEIDQNNRPHNPFVHGDLLYVSYYHDGLQVWDVTDPYEPLRAAYFDTYYQNNGSTYQNYHGAWGVYPYLSSGCLLVSDIENGFFTLKMESRPFTTRISSGDLFLEEAGSGIVFMNNDGEYYKMSVSGGALIYTLVGGPDSDKTQLRNSHFSFDTNCGIIFSDAVNGNKYRYSVFNGNPLLVTYPSPGDKNLIRITQGDIFLTRKNSGLVFVSSGTCHKIYVDSNGNLKNVITPCFNND